MTQTVPRNRLPGLTRGQDHGRRQLLLEFSTWGVVMAEQSPGPQSPVAMSSGLIAMRMPLQGVVPSLGQSGVDAKLIQQDVLAPWNDMGSGFDLVLCLGNTFMLFWDLDAATSLLTNCRTHMAPGGMVVIDDIPSEFQPEVDSGNWTTGLSPDGDLQMIWDEHDPIFTIRSGDSIDETSWSLQDDDVRLRLWTRQSLSHAAAAAGLSGPDSPVDGPGEGAVLVMRSTQA